MSSMYIRTKNGRIINTEKKYEPLQWAEQASDYALTIAQSKNLDKLCDEFVGINKSGNVIVQRVLAPSLKELKNSLKSTLNDKAKFDIIYGCIWTEWGLKYVAKMNENGELELI